VILPDGQLEYCQGQITRNGALDTFRFSQNKAVVLLLLLAKIFFFFEQKKRVS